MEVYAVLQRSERQSDLFHIGHAKEMQDYLDYVRHHPDLDSVLLPLGDGMELTYKKR